MSYNILDRLILKFNKKNIENSITDDILGDSKKSIRTGKDVNYKNFIKSKSGGRSLFKTGSLYYSLKSKNNEISMNEYGKFLDNGTKFIKKREFIPKPGSKKFSDIIKRIIKD